jgi:hypothetical protein
LQNFTPTVTSFNERYLYDWISSIFLEAVNNGTVKNSLRPGQQTSRSFATGIAGGQLIPIPSTPLCSVLLVSRFTVRVNGAITVQLDVPGTSSVPTDPFAKTASGIGSATITTGSPGIQFDFSPGSFNAQGWLDWFEVFGRRSLNMIGTGQLLFRDWNSVGSGTIAQFKITNGNNCRGGCHR